MKTRVHPVIRALFWGMLLSAAASSLGVTTNTQRFQANGAEFAIELPANWKELDPDVLEAMIDPYAEEDQATTRQVVRYGYGPDMSETLTNPPYIMMQVSRMRRMPERLMALQAKPAFLRRTVTNALKKGGVLEQNILETSYETNRYVARFSYTKTTPFAREQLRLLHSIFYTQEGAVTLVAVCPKEEWPRWTNTIEKAIASVQIPERLRYQPRGPLKARSPGSMMLEFSVVVLMVLGSGIAWIIYHRHSDAVMSDEI